MTHVLLVALNAIVSLASAGSAILALFRPAALSGSRLTGQGEIFYARLYAARSVPFGLASAILPIFMAGPAIATVLLLAAAIQVADIAIAVVKVQPGMIVGATAGAAIHLLCALAIR